MTPRGVRRDLLRRGWCVVRLLYKEDNLQPNSTSATRKRCAYRIRVRSQVMFAKRKLYWLI